MASYTTKQQVENYLQIDISTDLDTQVDSWIGMAEKYINTYTDRSFEASTETKKYAGGDDSIWVDDLLSVNNVWMVENDATGDAGTTELSTTDYYLKQGDNANKTPYNKIEISENGNYNYFESGQLNIWINGSWGFSTVVPEDIKMVATKLVASIVKSGKDGNIKSFSEHDYSVTYIDFENVLNSDIGVKSVLDMYKRSKAFNGFDLTKV